MENTTTIYDLLFGGYTPNSPALAIFPIVNLLVWVLSSIFFRVFHGKIPLPVQILLFASLMGTGTVAYLDIRGYTLQNLAIAGIVGAAILAASTVAMASWRNAPRKEVWSMKRRPLILALRMGTIVPMSLACALPIVASYYSLEASSIMSRGVQETADQIKRDADLAGGFMSKDMIARADKTITWYEADDKGWQRDAWRIGSFDLGRIIWNATNGETKAPSDLSNETWQVARIGFTYGKRATPIGFPVACEYRDGSFSQARFLLGGGDISSTPGLAHIAAHCPATFNPDGAPLMDPANINPPAAPALSDPEPKGIAI
ncbi:MAG: hypothetical protein ABJN42_03515 [Roseibium sp.]|uniref:hypothetical protein n=1 Tax=Roseibium sp. TaxID=1936156 RepID=UPI003299F9B7